MTARSLVPRDEQNNLAAASSSKKVRHVNLNAQQSKSKPKPESQRQRLFQKQLSQTIKLTGISSGISPKASGDMPIDFQEFRVSESETMKKKTAASDLQQNFKLALSKQPSTTQ